MAATRRDLLAGAAAFTATAMLPAAAAPAAAAPAAAVPAADATARATLAALVEEWLADYPENATSLGIDRGARAALRRRLTDRSAAADRARARRAARHLAALRATDRGAVTPATALDLDVAQAALETALDGWRFPFGDVATLNSIGSYLNTPYVVSQLSGAFVSQPDFLDSKHVVATAADADAYLARLEAYAGELDAESARIAADGARGVVLPNFLLDLTIRQMAAARARPLAEWTIVRSLADRAAAAGLGPRAGEAAARIAAERVAPALDRQLAALAALRPHATAAVAATRLPDGEAYYAWLLRAATTTEVAAAEMHALGLDQARTLQGQMDAILRAQGMTQGSVGRRMAALATRPDLLFADDDTGRAKLLAYLNGRIADIRTRLPRAFATLARGNLVIRRVPPEIEAGAPNGYAAPGSIDGSQPGIYYINLRDTAAWPRYSLPTLCYHEGIPGHVWQGEYTFGLPLIRTFLWFNAYTEGWALYAEQLADELGAYEGDPLGRLGYLQSMLFRACRLTVDTGLHAQGWSVAQALDWFGANTGMPAALLRGEVNRYCAMPGQACGYKMGHNAINRLRDRARAALGPRFDLRRFDDALVQGGNMPLGLLGRTVDRYIAAARG